MPKILDYLVSKCTSTLDVSQDPQDRASHPGDA